MVKLIFYFFAIILVKFIACEEDFYEILEIARDADNQAIKKAFRKASLKYHPDRPTGQSKEAQEKFMKINKAYETLTDPEKRKIYDIYGEEGLKNENNMMQQQNRQRSPNARIDIGVELEDLYNGATKEVSISKNIVCKSCHGTGGKLGKTTQCRHCGGRGMVMQNVQQMGFVFRMQQPCNVCSGKGIVFAETCNVCRGRKVVKEDKTLRVDVEKGMKDGENIVFPGESEQQPDMAPGDLIVHLKQSNHRFFNKRIDNDLYGNINLSLKEALLGYKRKVAHLDRRELTVNSDLPTQPFFVRKIENEGMPQHRYPSQKGHLYLKFNVRLPQKLTEEEKLLVNKLFE